MKKSFLTILTGLFLLCNSYASEMLPSTLLQLDDYFSHHVFVVEKATHKLHLYRNENGFPRHIKTVPIATGKKAGDKFFQGDHRTPEGVYQLTEFLTHQDLVTRHGKQGEIYGVGAFVLNYPNPIDRFAGKTGGGIWIHSTNDETRIEKGLDSRGCVVTANNELIKLSQYIELNKTSIIVVHDLKFLSKEGWELQKDKIMTTVNQWQKAWQEEDIEQYLASYHQKEFRDPVRGTFRNFATYKRAVFSNPGKPVVGLENISIMKTDDYAVVSFKQNYQSNTINDTGKKLLYLKKDEYYNWKIVSEVWTKVGIETPEDDQRVAFKPTQRFFETDNPSQILEIKYAKQNN